MGRGGRRTLVVLAAAAGALQLVPVRRSNPAIAGDVDAPPAVVRTLRAACYDCHSNETRWPWYSAVAPLSWFIAHDVEDARRRLNFSEWAEYADDPGTRATKLAKIGETVAAGDMAPWYYRLLHPEARLSDTDRQTLRQWVGSETATTSLVQPAAQRRSDESSPVRVAVCDRSLHLASR
jgi:hypothetical protein